MIWIALALASACFLGVYDIAKKSAVRDNAVPLVLLANVVTAASIWLPLVLYDAVVAADGVGRRAWPFQPFQLVGLSFHDHLLLAAKSLLVGTSWTLAFFALKALPLSIASPIRSTSPLWTILIAVGLLGERPGALQSGGIAIVLLSFLALSRVGRKEGIRFHRDRWVFGMIAATLLGATSSIYDKYLLQSCNFAPATVQAWFSIYLVPVMVPLAVRWRWFESPRQPFQWRYSIPLIAISLLIADFLYFTAIAQPDALISIISPVRRTAVLIPFLFGVTRLGEANWRPKTLCILGILTGVLLISIAT